jgi:hypothetical protein
MDIFKRYRNQNTKGIKGIIKVISEEVTMLKWKAKSKILLWKLNQHT